MTSNHPEDEQIDAEDFVRQCRWDARKFPRPTIEDVVRERVRRVVSRDFISGCADSAFENASPSVLAG